MPTIVSAHTFCPSRKAQFNCRMYTKQSRLALDWRKQRRYQEPITRSLQLPHIPVMAFSQTDLFLVWI